MDDKAAAEEAKKDNDKKIDGVCKAEGCRKANIEALLSLPTERICIQSKESELALSSANADELFDSLDLAMGFVAQKGSLTALPRQSAISFMGCLDGTGYKTFSGHFIFFSSVGPSDAQLDLAMGLSR